MEYKIGSSKKIFESILKESTIDESVLGEGEIILGDLVIPYNIHRDLGNSHYFLIGDIPHGCEISSLNFDRFVSKVMAYVSNHFLDKIGNLLSDKAYRILDLEFKKGFEIASSDPKGFDRDNED